MKLEKLLLNFMGGGLNLDRFGGKSRNVILELRG